jgi:hypothetical protein
VLPWALRPDGPAPGDFDQAARWLVGVAARVDAARNLELPRPGEAQRFWEDLTRLDGRRVSWRLRVRSANLGEDGQALVFFEEFSHSDSRGFRVSIIVEGAGSRALAVPADE